MSSNHRRCSSTGLMSPDVDVPGTSTSKQPGFGETAENDGFYLLKKDSQRRTTLSKVLQHDEKTICEVWLEKMQSEHKVQIVIQMVHGMNTIL